MVTARGSLRRGDALSEWQPPGLRLSAGSVTTAVDQPLTKRHRKPSAFQPGAAPSDSPISEPAARQPFLGQDIPEVDQHWRRHSLLHGGKIQVPELVPFGHDDSHVCAMDGAERTLVIAH